MKSKQDILNEEEEEEKKYVFPTGISIQKDDDRERDSYPVTCRGSHYYTRNSLAFSHDTLAVSPTVCLFLFSFFFFFFPSAYFCSGESNGARE
jgi:hypothetical protein